MRVDRRGCPRGISDGDPRFCFGRISDLNVDPRSVDPGCPDHRDGTIPKGLGRTVEELQLSLPENAVIVEKTTFSACGEPDLVSKLNGFGTKQAIICGIEAHICVNQTVHDLIASGYEVHILADCVSSRFENDKTVGLHKMQTSGAIVSSTEMALFEIMRDSKHEKFKEIQALIK